MKYHVLEISHGLWGYVTDMSDWSGGRAGKAGQTPDGEHTLKDGLDGTLIPGVPDSELLGYMPSGYGFARPWQTEGISEEEKQLQEKWMRSRVPEIDYYVALQNGCPDPSAVRLYYPERVFVSGVDDEDDGRKLTRLELLEHLKAVDLRGYHGFWNPVQIFHGIHSGFPHFSPGMKAHTDMGCSWFEVNQKLSGSLPEGYSWDVQTQGAEAGYGLLYFEMEEVPA